MPRLSVPEESRTEKQFKPLAISADINRRTLLATLGASTGIGLAGCVGGGDDSDDSQGSDDTPYSIDDQTDSTDNGTADETESPDGDSGDQTESTDDASDDGGDGETGQGDLPTATLQTSFGDVEVELYAERVPNTVENFVGLSTGERTWVDPETGEDVEGEPLYDDVLFHRVIEGFMVQTGDPTGTGRGGPGYTFDDEFHEDLRHDGAGVVSMANSGPDTNGSQFFITLDAQPHLDGRHAVFGQVTSGMDVVEEIGSVETDGNDRPVEDVLLESVTIHEA